MLKNATKPPGVLEEMAHRIYLEFGRRKMPSIELLDFARMNSNPTSCGEVDGHSNRPRKVSPGIFVDTLLWRKAC